MTCWHDWLDNDDGSTKGNEAKGKREGKLNGHETETKGFEEKLNEMKGMKRHKKK